MPGIDTWLIARGCLKVGKRSGSVMLTEFEEEMRGYINDEPFVHAIDLSTSLSKPRSLSGSSFLPV